MWGEGQQNITCTNNTKHLLFTVCAHIRFLKWRICSVLFTIAQKLEFSGGRYKTVYLLHVAGHCSQHASLSRLLPSVCSDRWLPQVILNSNNKDSSFQEKHSLTWNKHCLPYTWRNKGPGVCFFNWIVKADLINKFQTTLKYDWICEGDVEILKQEITTDCHSFTV